MSPTDVPASDLEIPELTDPELISRVRGGDVTAYGMLFSRHVDAATRLARLLVNGSDADDLVSEAFVKVLNVLLGGDGPDVAFRAYLLTAVRRLHIDKVRSNQRLTTTDDLTPFDPGVPFTDTAVAGFEGGAAAKAFASLPERWQLVLWHLEVENQKPADIAPLLGMSPNSVSALAYRAREGLRQAFLQMHAGDLVSDACRETNDLLGGYVRGALSRRDSTRVDGHLGHCRRCAAVYLELSEVNSSLAAVLGAAVLGGAAAGYLGTGATTGMGAGVLALLGRGKEVVVTHVSASAATAAVIGVAGITAFSIVHQGPQEQRASADERVQADVAPQAVSKTGPKTGSSSGSSKTGSTGTTGGLAGAAASGSSLLTLLTGAVSSEDPAGAATGSGDGSGNGDGTGTTSGGGDTDPGITNPGTTNPGITNPGITNPGITNPGTTDPGTTDPGTTNPANPNPGTTNPANPNPNPGGGPGTTTPVPDPTPKPTPTPAPTPTPKPTETPKPTPTLEPSPKPNPTPKPTETPKPTPTLEPSPKPNPTSNPTATSRPNLKADVGVRVWSVSGIPGTGIRVQVTGIPARSQVRLAATASNGDLHLHWGSCRRTGNGHTCTATGSRNAFLFSVQNHAGPRLTFSVTPPDGYRDSSWGNNMATIQVPPHGH